MKDFLKKAHKWAKILGHCYGVRAIFLSGSVAEGRATEASDIDFFIIAKSGQIWTARFFIFLALKLFNQLAKPQHHAGKICPNHFIADHGLEIIEQDLYSAHLFTHNKPLYDPDGVFPLFVRANEKWVKVFREDFNDGRDVACYVSTKSFPKKEAGKIEKFLEVIQRWKIEKNPDFKKAGAVIVLNDNELRFHPEPKNKKKKV
jgi:predicted nucleotidyltransferase